MMKKRLLCLGLLAAVSQLLTTGCHPVARWRANHPCGACGPVYRPALHPIKTRQAILGEYAAPVGVASSPVMSPPCHGCGGSPGAPGVPVGLSGAHYEGIPVTPTAYPPVGGYPPIANPAIGQPIPIAPGPKVIPSHELPNPMPLPK
jgi:hypothetical protein